MYDKEVELNKIDIYDLVRRVCLAKTHCDRLVKTSGSFTFGAAMQFETGDSWQTMAIIDVLIDTGMYREPYRDNDVAYQHRVFVEAG